MRSSDVTVTDCAVDFRPVRLDPPLVLSSGPITAFTVAYVRLMCTDRSGRSGPGEGTTVLSVPWAWPQSALPVGVRDNAMRDLCRRIGQAATAMPAADPIRTWCELSAGLSELSRVPDSEPMPRLAALLCLGAVDNAVHDAWSRIAGKPAYAMYDQEHLTDDLATAVDPALNGRFPADFLRPARERIAVQHLVSIDDPLTAAETDANHSRSLQDWVRADGIRHLKVKVLGRDPQHDAAWVAAVHRTALQCAGPVSIAVDPNEGCESAEQVAEFVRALCRNHPDTAAALTYIEQPVRRGGDFTGIGEPIPILMDEGLASIDTLRGLAGSGWGGLVVKAGKGQTHALLAHSYARFNRMFLTVQDLTAVDLAFRHSARLASVFDLSAEHLEYNSRQYAAPANAALARTDPELATVRGGAIRLGPLGAGIH